MRSVQIVDNFGIDALKITEPASRPLGPYQVRVRVRAVSLNYRDMLVAKGLYNKRLPLPLTICSDAAGEILELGPGASRWKVGDRVAAAFMPEWIAGEPDDAKARSAMGAFSQGVLADELVLSEQAFVSIPGHLSFEEASTLPCAAVTAWNALVVAGRIKAGDTVLALGTGGVSLFALQFARMHGARVIITSSSDEKLARARDLGAGDGINYRETPEWGDVVRKLAGAGVDHVVEVGGGTLNQSLRATRTGGHVAVIGVVAGAAEANLVPLFMKSMRMSGIFVGSRDMFEAMNRAISASGVRPVIDRVFDLDQTQEALTYMESGAHFGKIVIRL